MGKKVVGILVIGLVIALVIPIESSYSTNISTEKSLNHKTESAMVFFSPQPTLSEKDGFVEIQVDGATTQLLEPNKPVLPIYVNTYQIPFGSTDIQVTCAAEDISRVYLTQEIIPARIALSSQANMQTA